MSLQGENLDRRLGGLATSVAALPLNRKDYELLQDLCRRCREVLGPPESRCDTCFLRQPLFSFGEASIGSEDGGSSGPEWNRPRPPDADRLELRLFGGPWREVHRRLGGDPRLASCLELIESQYSDESLTLGRAARHTGLSRSRLNAGLGKGIGRSFHQLLTRFRLLRAVERMRSRPDTLLEVAEATGFGSLSSFHRHCVRHLGCAPGRFRAGLS